MSPSAEQAGSTASAPGAAVAGGGVGPWCAVVWNDPVNLMSYVEYVFRSYFGYSAPKARALMLRVHHEGWAVVARGTREQIEMDVIAMHQWGLQATLENGDF